MKRILTAAALVALSFASHAELVSTDWKTAGDELATLDTETGIEWMDLSETDGLSINTVLSMTSAGGKFEGWRLPTEDEVLTLFDAAFTGTFVTGSNTSAPKFKEQILAFHELFGYTSYNIDRAYGLYEQDDGDVVMIGVRNNETVYFNFSEARYSTSFSHDVLGVLLVSDGGDTISSIDDPSLNIMNPNSPYNVPIAGSGALALLALGAVGRRKRQ